MFISNVIPAVATAVALTIQTVHPLPQAQNTHELAYHIMPMGDRYPVTFVSDVFKDNILLTLAYMRGDMPGKKLTWGDIEKPFHFEFTLQPHENFAFHDTVLQQYQGQISQTTHAHFTYNEGFKYDGDLVGDGVCHLASLMNWVAKDAGLETVAPTTHDFANIPDVPKQYGVAIFTDPENASTSAEQNLYITNTKEKPVTFAFDYKNNILTLTATED